MPSSIALRCRCGARLVAPSDAFGQQARCERCNNEFEVPFPALKQNREVIPRTAQIDRKKVEDVFPLAVNSIQLIARCPRCRCRRNTWQNLAHCKACGFDFTTSAPVIEISEIEEQQVRTRVILFMLLISVIFIIACIAIQSNFNDKLYLKFFFSTFVVMGVLHTLLRAFVLDSRWVSFLTTHAIVGMGAVWLTVKLMNGGFFSANQLANHAMIFVPVDIKLVTVGMLLSCHFSLIGTVVRSQLRRNLILFGITTLVMACLFFTSAGQQFINDVLFFMLFHGFAFATLILIALGQLIMAFLSKSKSTKKLAKA